MLCTALLHKVNDSGSAHAVMHASEMIEMFETLVTIAGAMSQPQVMSVSLRIFSEPKTLRMPHLWMVFVFAIDPCSICIALTYTVSCVVVP